MKRIAAIIVALMFSVTMLFAQSVPSGKYQLTFLGNDEVNMMEILEMMEVDTSGFFIEFLSGGRFRMSLDDEVAEGTFRLTRNSISLFFSEEDSTDQVLQGKIEGNKIFLDEEVSNGVVSKADFSMIFEKK